ncbi:MAG: glycosyltransferase [Candidatus Bathyarchaeia archaeon]
MIKPDKVDVAILTKNSERMLEKCLFSVYENVPVNRLIVVDGYSIDSTIEILRKFQQKYGNVEIIRTHGTRGYARQIAIKHVETEWFMFVDSDVVLCKNWFKKALRLIREDVGAIWGMEVWSTFLRERRSILELFMRVNMKVFEQRGGTHDILIRKDALKGIKIPWQLHTYEDAYIKDWIVRSGFRVIPTYDPYCIHYRPEKAWTIKGSIEIAAGDLPHAVKRPQLIAAYAIFTGVVMRQIFIKKTKLKEF